MKITLSELRRIIKNVINEQLEYGSDTDDDAVSNLVNPNYAGATFKGRTITFYSDPANTAPLVTVKILELYPPHQGNSYAAIEIQTNKGKDYPIMYDCKRGVAQYRGPETQNKVVNLYNNAFLAELKKLCKR